MSVQKFFHLLMYHFILSARQKRGLIMRIDKFLSNAGAGSRSQVKTDLKKGLVLVNGQAVRSADFQVVTSTASL